MRDGEHGALVVVEELLQPQDALGIQVVRGLVEQQQVGRLEKQAAEGHAPALATREHVHGRVRVGALEGVHGLGELGVQVPSAYRVNLVLELAHLGHEGVEVRVGVGHLSGDGIEAVHLGKHVTKGHANVLDDGLVVVQRGLLLEQAHGVARREARVAVGDLLLAGHDLEQRGLAHAVGANHADLCAGEEAQGDVIEDDLVTMALARLEHLVDELRHSHLLGIGREIACLGCQSPPSLSEAAAHSLTTSACACISHGRADDELRLWVE